LRRSPLTRTSVNFTQSLMEKAAAERRYAVEDIKRDRIAKYIIGIFISLILAVTIMIGYASKREVSSGIETSSVKIQPTIETSTNYLQKFSELIESASLKVISILGFSANSDMLTIIFYIILLIAFYLAADRIFLKGRLKSSHS
jgi:hypothetical protein